MRKRIVKKTSLAIAAVLLASSVSALAQEAKEKEFFQALNRRITSEERAQWDAYVSREGADKLAKSYYPFADGACREMKKGTSDKALLANYVQFFGPNAAPILGAAKEVICPELGTK